MPLLRSWKDEWFSCIPSWRWKKIDQPDDPLTEALGRCDEGDDSVPHEPAPTEPLDFEYDGDWE
jgi:hypothetical protein